MGESSASPYEVVLGDRLLHLHPSLRRYFAGIPSGRHGFGSGTFDRVGSPRRLLWPVLWVLGRAGIAFPGWHEQVRFTVVNRPVPELPAAIAAVRSFQFSAGQRDMVDQIGVLHTAAGPVLVDRLGSSGRLIASFNAVVSTAHGGCLRLESTRVGFALGARNLWWPRALSPRVLLTERFDDDSDAQHVSIVLAHPALGRLYEYSGFFRYELAGEEG